eukprot:1286791-Pleurochrysis_carterae.AAC.1
MENEEQQEQHFRQLVPRRLALQLQLPQLPPLLRARASCAAPVAPAVPLPQVRHHAPAAPHACAASPARVPSPARTCARAHARARALSRALPAAQVPASPQPRAPRALRALSPPACAWRALRPAGADGPAVQLHRWCCLH